MIDPIVAAPRQWEDTAALALAQSHGMGLETTAFSEPATLDDIQAALMCWKPFLSGLKAPVILEGPSKDLNPLSAEPQIVALTQSRYVQAVSAAIALNAKFVTFDTSYRPTLQIEQGQDAWFRGMVKFWQRFAAEHLTETASLCLALTNGLMGDPALLAKLVEEIGHSQIKAGLDTGLANLYSKSTLMEWVDTLDHHLAYVRAHNNYGVINEYRGFAYGTIDMERFLNHLIIAPYQFTVSIAAADPLEFEESAEMLSRFITAQESQLPKRTFLI